MAFMVPVAERFAAYHVETDCGIEIVPEATCGRLPSDYRSDAEVMAPYLEGTILPGGAIEPKEGWYGRLSAPGYLDCTDWDGPYATADEALDAVKAQYDVDDDGNKTYSPAELRNLQGREG